MGRSSPWCRWPRRVSCMAEEEGSFPVARRSSICSRKSSNYSAANQLRSFSSLLFPKMVCSRPLRVPAAAGPLQPVSAPSVLLCAQSVCPASNLFLSIQSHLLVAEPKAAALFPSVITDPCPPSPAIYPILSPHLQRAPFQALPAAHIKSACCGEWAAARPKVLERNLTGNSTHEFYFTYPSGATFKNHHLLQPPSAGRRDTNSACISRRLSASHLGKSGICFLNFVLPFWSCSRCAAAYAPPGTQRLSSNL